MPARDLFHDAVKNALVKEGWTITHDPFRLDFGFTDAYVDLGAEKILAAEKGLEKIAIEITSFVGKSELYDFHGALGQFITYRFVLRQAEPERTLLSCRSQRHLRDLISSKANCRICYLRAM